eukprot:IDg14423t1
MQQAKHEAAVLRQVVRAVAKHAAQTFADSAHRDSGGVEKDEQKFRTVLCGDGSRGRCGMSLEEGKVYARSSMLGRHESYWKVQANTPRLCTQDSEVLRGSVFPVTLSALQSCTSPQGPVVNMRGMKSAQMRLTVFQNLAHWVQSNRSVAVLVGRCVDSALIHAIWRILGEESGQAALRYFRDRLEHDSIMELGNLLNLIQ